MDAVGYLAKPIDHFGFAFKMRKVEDLVAKRQGVTIPLTVGTGTQFLSSHDVRYIEVLGHEVIYRTDTTAYKVWSSLKDAAALLDVLARYGYQVTPEMTPAQQKRVIMAFQMHFRPARWDGVADAQTLAIAEALLEKYGRG